MKSRVEPVNFAFNGIKFMIQPRNEEWGCRFILLMDGVQIGLSTWEKTTIEGMKAKKDAILKALKASWTARQLGEDFGHALEEAIYLL